MHGDPHVPNNGRRGRGLLLRPGLVIAIEPWFLAGTDKIYTDSDGWTLRSRDGSRGAHAEHTVAITSDGPQQSARGSARNAARVRARAAPVGHSFDSVDW
jgi:methionine aminopeptidase